MTIIVLAFKFIYKAMAKSNNIEERIVYIILAIVDCSILIIYYLDKFNVPTELGWNTNVNTQNWLIFIGTFITGILTAGIGAIVSVAITIYQIKKNNEENNRRDKENLRIQNIPIIKYDINTERKSKGDISELIITNQDNEKGHAYCLNVVLKNIGQNTIKNTIIDFNSDIINNSIYRLSGKDSINPLEKGESLEINKFFSLKPSDKNYEIKLIVYYQDVLSNWYKQEVIVYYNATNVFDYGGYIGNVKHEVKSEQIIEEDEIEENVI